MNLMLTQGNALRIPRPEKKKNVPGRVTHSFHAARKEKGVTDLPMFSTPVEELGDV